MIFNISVLALMVCVGCLYGVGGASFSKVYVSSRQEAVPLEYIQYGAPAVAIPGPQIARISAAPIGSVIPVASSPNLIPPCNTPCVLSGPAIPPVAQIASAAPNSVTYKTDVPVVLRNDKEPTGYEYSYVVYDENTGDHKAQQETSDGAVVKGEYSLIQPDGFVREVQYTADDLRGFNAIVKKFLPVNVASKGDHKEQDHPAPPCHEVKNESLESSEHHEKHEESDHTDSHDEDKYHEIHEAVPSHEVHGDEHSAKGDESSSSEESHELVKDANNGHTDETHDKKSEALTEGSLEDSEAKDSSEEGSVEEHAAHAGEHKADEHDEHQFNEKPYHDIIKCVQTAINGKNHNQIPLTYIILNNPC